MNGFVSDSIVAAQAANETAAARCIGLTIETKPDCFLGSEVDACLALGTTRVELGIQSTTTMSSRRCTAATRIPRAAPRWAARRPPA